jgi:hypothetical protein
MKDPVADVVALEALWSAEYVLVVACFMKSGRNHEERDIKIRSIHVGDEAARQRSFWRDRWARAGVVGIILSCLACTSVSAFILATLGLGLWVGRVEVVAVAVFVASVIVLGWRYARGRRRG